MEKMRHRKLVIITLSLMLLLSNSLNIYAAELSKDTNELTISIYYPP